MLARILAHMFARVRILAFIGLCGPLTLSVGCDGKSPTAPPAPLDLTGTWSGQLAQRGSTPELRLTWTAIHRGDAVAGVVTVVNAASTVRASGIMTGVVTNNRLVVTLAVAPGDVQGFERCAAAGRGDAAATTNDISGSISFLSTACAGTGLEPADTRELRLVR